MPNLIRIGLFASLLSWAAQAGLAQPGPSHAPLRAGPAAVNPDWQSPARLRHGLKAAPGTLVFDAGGIEFRSEPRYSHRWPFVEIQTFDLTPRHLALTGYEKRDRHRSGDLTFRFDLSVAVPPAIAEELARRVGKPVRNGVPNPQAPSFATIPARHRMHGGGNNGTLRFREEGIDYIVTTGPRGKNPALSGAGRSWRWSDIETLSSQDPYHLRVSGYRETFEFEVKEPLSRELFDRLWDRVYARDLNVSPAQGGDRP